MTHLQNLISGCFILLQDISLRSYLLHYIADVLILTLQGGTTVTIVIGLAMHLLEVPGGVILVRRHYMLLLGGSLALLLTVPQKGP